VILAIYRNRCSLTGIDLPEVNRASHIISWAERSETRMDPRNGICLSATYDAAFDRKLITFDDGYRLVLSKSIRDRVPSDTLKHHFLSKEGQQLELPARFHPLKEYLEHHRKGGEF
jgi:putative restriction endonuclease